MYSQIGTLQTLTITLGLIYKDQCIFIISWFNQESWSFHQVYWRNMFTILFWYFHFISGPETKTAEQLCSTPIHEYARVNTRSKMDNFFSIQTIFCVQLATCQFQWIYWRRWGSTMLSLSFQGAVTYNVAISTNDLLRTTK